MRVHRLFTTRVVFTSGKAGTILGTYCFNHLQKAPEGVDSADALWDMNDKHHLYGLKDGSVGSLDEGYVNCVECLAEPVEHPRTGEVVYLIPENMIPDPE